MLLEWLGVSHILSEVRVGWEHGYMSGGYTTLQGLAKNYSTGFILVHLNLSTLLLCEATLEHWTSYHWF